MENIRLRRERIWFPGVADGILRGVALEILPAVHIEDVRVLTQLAPDTLRAQVLVRNAADHPVTATLAAALSSWNHHAFHYPPLPEVTLALAPGESRVVELGPAAWTLGPASFLVAECPLSARLPGATASARGQLNVNGTLLQAYRQRFGFRQFAARGNHYELNGIRCNLRGDNQQEANFGPTAMACKAGFGPPTAANPGWPQAVDNLLRLNFNVLRIHQIPATPVYAGRVR